MCEKKTDVPNQMQFDLYSSVNNEKCINKITFTKVPVFHWYFGTLYQSTMFQRYTF